VNTTGTGGVNAGTGGAIAGTGGAVAGTGGSGTGGAGTGGAGGACMQGVSCVPAGGGDPCGRYAFDCSSGTAVCLRVGNQLPGTACTGGVCSPAGSCAACQADAECTPSASPCRVGTLSCDTGQPVCTAGSATRPDGWACGADRVCHSGTCTPCVANEACTPLAGACVQGFSSCATGAYVCEAQTPVPAGGSCGTNKVCDGLGGCVACQQSLACTPTNVCHAGALSCSTGSPVCADMGTALPDNVYCDINKLCSAGACVDAGNWITRGEDARTTTGGWVFAAASGGATISPITSTTMPFTPTAGTLTVSGTLPPQNPAQNIFPFAGLGWNFRPGATAFNASSRGGGFQFYARSQYAVSLTIQVGDIWTDPTYTNCSTVGGASAVNVCYQYPTNLDSSDQLTGCNLPAGNGWTLCRFRWSDFKRPKWGNAGDHLPLDPSNITVIEASVPTPAAATPAVNFAFSLDDVSFVPPAVDLPGVPLATFDTTTEGANLNSFDDPQNLVLHHNGAAPALSWSSDQGSPHPGSLKVVAPFDGYNQWVDVAQKSFGQNNLQNWTGKRLHMRIMLENGAGFTTDPVAPGGVNLYVMSYDPTQANAYAWAAQYTTLARSAAWQELIFDPSSLALPAGWDAKKVLQFGTQINTGLGAGSSIPPTAATFYIDSYWLE
jgi:hypothetical protein